ncbi:MAG: ABC transporter permease [Cellulosilyticaceae bacterium]
MQIKSRVRYFIQGFLILHIVWFVAANMMHTMALPGPGKVYGYLPKVIAAGVKWHVVASLYRVILGLGIAVAIGMVIGILMGTWEKMNQLLNPLVYFTYPMPKTAFLPIVMILFGLGDGSKIILIVLITVFQVIVVVRDAILHIDKGMYHIMKSLGASKWQMFWQVTLPAILPELLTNMRVSVGTALSVLFFAENYGTRHGLGYYIQDCWMRLDYLGMYGGILILSFLGFFLFMSIDFIERVLCKGYVEER